MSQTGDPFLDAFHALQPDVDIVVLPPEGTPAGLPVAGRPDAAAACRATARAAAALLDQSGLSVEDHPRAIFDSWRRLRGDVHAHRTRIRVEHSDAPAALDSLLRVRDNLEAAGWGPAPIDSPTPWLVAKAPTGLDLEAVAERHHLIVTVTSPPLRLAEDPE